MPDWSLCNFWVTSDWVSVSGDIGWDHGMNILSAQDGIEEMSRVLHEPWEWRYTVIKQQTWREDQAWFEYLEACLEWMNSWGKLYILKDTQWIPFSLSESSRWDMLSPNPSKLYRFKWWVSRKFYNNTAIEISTDLYNKIQKTRELLLSHQNLSIEIEYRCDHSKLQVTGNENGFSRLFFWWASIWNEWSHKWENQYIDCVIDVQDTTRLKMFAHALSWISNQWQDGLCILTRHNYHSELCNILTNNQGDVRSSIAYLWESARIWDFDSRERVEMILSREANTNRWRNLHFLHELLRRKNRWFSGGLRGCNNVWELIRYWKSFCSMSVEQIPEDMKIIFLESVLHMKAVCGKDFAVLGSGNMVEWWYGELGIALQWGLSRDVDHLILSINSLLTQLINESNTFGWQDTKIKMNLLNSCLSDSELISFSLLRSQIEHIVMSLESFMIHTIRKKRIKEVQSTEEGLFRSLIS